MGDNSADQPAWGTPPRQASSPENDEIPAWGSPAGPGSPAASGPAEPASEPEAVRAPHLLTADTIGVIERSGFMTGRSYELVAADGTSLGYLTEQTSAGTWLFGGAASSTFTMKDAAGQLVATMHRPGSFGRFQFLVSDADGADVGTVEQENAFFAPQFDLRSADGLVMRLVGGSFGGTDWELVGDDEEPVLYGRVSQEFAGLSGMLGGTQRFAVRLSPALSGRSRLLAVTATACLDYVRDAKKRR